MGYFFAYPWTRSPRPGTAVSSAYLALFEGAILDFGSLTGGSNVPILGPISDTLFNAAPLILGGLSVGCVQAVLFNIGGQGADRGAICAGYVGFAWHLPVLLHLLVAMVAGLIGGAIWGGIAGWLKARTGARGHLDDHAQLHRPLPALLPALRARLPGGGPTRRSRSRSRRPPLPPLFGSGLSVNGSLIVALLCRAWPAGGCC
jgi:simple sugar transport system permease protein